MSIKGEKFRERDKKDNKKYFNFKINKREESGKIESNKKIKEM